MTAVVESSKLLLEKLTTDGWHLCPEKVSSEIEDFEKLSSKVALEELKNCDLKQIGIACFPDDAAKVASLRTAKLSSLA